MKTERQKQSWEKARKARIENHIEEWRDICSAEGFTNERDLFHHLYWEKGLSLNQIGVRLGFERSAIRDHMIKAGVPLRGRGGANNPAKITNEQKNEMYNYYKETGKPPWRVGQVFGVSRWSVRRAIKYAESLP